MRASPLPGWRQRRRWTVLGKCLKQTLQECKKHVHRIPYQKSNGQRRDGGSLRDVEVIKQADNSASDAGDDKTGKIDLRRSKRPSADLLFEGARQKGSRPQQGI
jgi:hypothetical protein